MLTLPALDFQRLSPTDAPLLSKVAKRAYSEHYLHLWHDAGAWYIERSFSLDVLRQELEDPNARLYLVRRNGEPVGFFKLSIDQALPGHETEDALELERTYLVKEVTGQGVGKAVMQFVFTCARQLRRQLVWLKAMDTSHDAIAFYKKMGFQLCGTERLSYEMMKEDVRGMVVFKRNIL